MKRKRKKRQHTRENWALVPINDNYAIPAVLENISDTGAFFELDFDVHVHDRVVACPWDVEQGSFPTAAKVLQHPKRKQGVIVRFLPGRGCGVRFDVTNERVFFKSLLGSFQVQVFQNGFDVTVEAIGNPDIEMIAKFRDEIMKYARNALRIQIDFTCVEIMPAIGCSIIGKLLKKLADQNKIIATVSCAVHCPNFSGGREQHGTLFHFSDRNASETFLKTNPLKAIALEDDRVSLHLMERYLTGMNVEPYLTATLEDGLKYLKDNTPDFILMDFHLAEIDGIEAINRIRSASSPYVLPIIIVTMDSSRETFMQSLEANVSGYLLKPFNEMALTEQIVKAISS